MNKLLLAPLVGLAVIASAGVVGATQTCIPGEIACTGDSGSDPYAHCDGLWVDTWAGIYYHQVCVGHDGTNHVCIDFLYNGCDLDLHV